MTVELLQTLSLVSWIIAGVLFLTGIALFFLLDVPKLYGEVTGKTARKAIEAIRQQNEKQENKVYRPSAVNANRSRLTAKISQSGSLASETEGLPMSTGTEKFATATLAPQNFANEIMVLSEPANETTVLSQASNETTVLKGNACVDYGNEFMIEVEMCFIGSSEIIE